MSIITSSIIILGSIAFVSGLILYFVSQKFYVKEDARVAEVEKELPGVNCGACGKAGCHDFAISCCKADTENFKKLCLRGPCAKTQKYFYSTNPQAISISETNTKLSLWCQILPGRTK